jgi:ribokinase
MDGPLQVVGVGLACLDLLIRAEELPTWERGVRLSGMAIEGGGPVATAMVTVQRLGVPAGMVGVYGSDRLGEIKLQTLVENGVDTSRMVRRDGPERQAVLVSVHEESGERVFSGMGWQPGFVSLAEDELDRAYVTSAQYLHLDGFHAPTALATARWMHAAGKQVMLDGSATHGPIASEMRALVEEVDILICGSGFGPALTGRRDVWEAGQAILDLGPRVVVQTEGAQGSYTVTRAEYFHTPAFPVNVIDTTGAGDVFHGAYLVGLLKGWRPREIALFSSAVAAIKCTRLGGRPGIPSFAQAMAFLAERGIRFEA